MQTHASGSAVLVSVDLTSVTGSALVPTALAWRVLDEAGTVIQDWQDIPVNGSEVATVSVTIAGAFNILTPPATRGIRTVLLRVTTDSGEFLLSSDVMLQTISALAPWHNSFQTYQQALLATHDYPEVAMSAWVRTSDRAERERAMIQSHRAILMLPIYVGLDDFSAPLSADSLKKVVDGRLALRDLALDDHAFISARLLHALRHAQVLEANEALNADPVVLARRNGLMSLTVGESSQFFGASKPLENPMLSKPALDLLQPWLSYRVRIGRTG